MEEFLDQQHGFFKDIGRGEETAFLAWVDWLTELADAGHEWARDRAEFVRVQCELERTGRVCPFTLHHPEHILTDSHKKYVVPPRIKPKRPCGWCPVCLAVAREHDLLRLHGTGWRKAGPCRGCGGDGKRTGMDGSKDLLPCPACSGTGDKGGLLVRSVHSSNPRTFVLPVHFRRGLLDRVEVPTLGDCFEEICGRCGSDRAESRTRGGGCAGCEGGHGPHFSRRPTPWLRTVVAHHPTVTQMVPLSVQPVYIGAPQLFRGGHIEPESPYRIPELVFDAMTTELVDTAGSGVVSRRFDADDLGRAIVKVAKDVLVS